MMGPKTSRGAQLRVLRIVDQHPVLDCNTAEFGLGCVCCVTIASGVVRLHNPDGHDVFLEVTSGRPIPREQADARVRGSVARDIPGGGDPWRLANAETLYPKETSCGDFLVRMAGRHDTWLVAVRKPQRADLSGQDKVSE